MIISYARMFLLSSEIIVVLVEPELVEAGAGDGLIARIERHIPAMPIMLVAVVDNGFKAYAVFNTQLFLALLQLEDMELIRLNLDEPSPVVETEIPF